MLKQLAEERAQRLENHDLGGVYDEIADELRGLIDEERGALDKLNDTAKSSGDERRADITQNTVTEKHMHLDLLPSDLAGQVKGLENYDFQSAEAQQRFDDLMDQLREQLMQSQLDQMAEGVSDMSPEDLQRMKDMFAELNNMLDQRQQGEEPDFASTNNPGAPAEVDLDRARGLMGDSSLNGHSSSFRCLTYQGNPLSAVLLIRTAIHSPHQGDADEGPPPTTSNRIPRQTRGAQPVQIRSKRIRRVPTDGINAIDAAQPRPPS